MKGFYGWAGWETPILAGNEVTGYVPPAKKHSKAQRRRRGERRRKTILEFDFMRSLRIIKRLGLSSST